LETVSQYEKSVECHERSEASRNSNSLRKADSSAEFILSLSKGLRMTFKSGFLTPQMSLIQETPTTPRSESFFLRALAPLRETIQPLVAALPGGALRGAIV
jgi:hypothetical protein